MMLICVGKLSIIGSDNGVVPGRRQAIVWINDGVFVIGLLGTNFGEIWIGIQTFSIKEVQLKMLSSKWHPFCLGLNELKCLPLSSALDTDITDPIRQNKGDSHPLPGNGVGGTI